MAIRHTLCVERQNTCVFVLDLQTFVLCMIMYSPVPLLQVLFIYLLTQWNRVLLEKLTGYQLVKKIPACYGSRRFINACTNTRHLSLSWASSTQSIPPHPTFRRFNLILSSHLCPGLPSGLFPSGFATKACICLSSLHTCYTPRPSLLLDLIIQIIFVAEYRSLSSLLCSFLHSPPYLIPFRPKYSPQYPILKHPQPTFLPQ
jgi:hypothetical protein